MIKKGDIINILPEFQDDGDDQYTWVALNDEELGRFDASPVDIEMNIIPIYTFNNYQVQA